jgi:hypothetical protein
MAFCSRDNLFTCYETSKRVASFEETDLYPKNAVGFYFSGQWSPLQIIFERYNGLFLQDFAQLHKV